jgi:hypothetical protein
MPRRRTIWQNSLLGSSAYWTKEDRRSSKPTRSVRCIVSIGSILGVDTGIFTKEAYDIVAPAIAKALESPDEAKRAPTEFEKYTGLYRDFWGESAVLTWEGSLATVWTRTSNPSEGLTKLKHIEGYVFRRVREDDEELGEEIVFEVDQQGRVVRMQQHGNYMEKVR